MTKKPVVNSKPQKVEIQTKEPGYNAPKAVRPSSEKK